MILYDLTALILILILGIIGGLLVRKINLPGLIGMLLVGIIIGPSLGNLITPNAMEAAPHFRAFALIIILIRAGLGLKWDALKKVSLSVLYMSFIPCLCEVLFIILPAHYLLGLAWLDAILLGTILAAVSPAVVVPLMLRIEAEKQGEKKGIPSLILASASLDDVFAITFFSLILTLAVDPEVAVWKQASLFPVSVILGLLYGILAGAFTRHVLQYIKLPLFRALTLLVVSIIIYMYNPFTFAISQLLGVMTCAFVVQYLSTEKICIEPHYFKRIWFFAEVFLFVYIGAALDLSSVPKVGLMSLFVIVIALCGRSLGVWLSLKTSNLTLAEKGFCMISYLPKATVQAAIGGMPLALGIAGGEIILTVACLSIILTAPLGAILISKTAPKLLEN